MKNKNYIYYKNNQEQNNIKKVNYSIDDKSNTNIIFANEDKNNDMAKINKLLNILKVNNIDEAIYRVDSLLKFEKDINNLKYLYNNNSNEDIDINTEKNNFDNNLIWLKNIIRKFKKNEVYKNYCKNIMIKNKIRSFDEFKKYINQILIKNKKNKGFIVEVKNLLCEEDYYSNNHNINKNNNKISYEKNKIINTEINKEGNDSKNSNDIIFTQDDENNNIKNKNMNTFY